METITWITAQTGAGADAICAEASARQTVERFTARAERDGALMQYVRRPFGRHFDGGALSADEMRRLRAGIRRNS